MEILRGRSSQVTLTCYAMLRLVEQETNLIVGPLESIQLSLFGIADTSQDRRQCELLINVIISDVTVEIICVNE